MVTIGMNYDVITGKEEVFEAACDNVLEAMAGMDGHDESEIYRRVEADAPPYLLLSRWSSEEAFHAFVASDAFKKVTNWGKEYILRGRPQHTTYRQNDDGSVSSAT